MDIVQLIDAVRALSDYARTTRMEKERKHVAIVDVDDEEQERRVLLRARPKAGMEPIYPLSEASQRPAPRVQIEPLDLSTSLAKSPLELLRLSAAPLT